MRINIYQFLSQQIIIALILVDLIVASTIDTIQSVVFESIDSDALRSLEARFHCLSPLISDSIFPIIFFSRHTYLSIHLRDKVLRNVGHSCVLECYQQNHRMKYTEYIHRVKYEREDPHG